MPLDEEVIAPAALVVHADPDAVRLEQPGELLAGELTALVGVEYPGAAVTDKGFLYRLDVEIRGLGCWTSARTGYGASPSPAPLPDRVRLATLKPGTLPFGKTLLSDQTGTTTT